jgi:hypothetical protein
MRTAAEIQEKIEHLISYKKELYVHFKVIELSKQKHAALSAFYRTVDYEIDMLRWALGLVDATWSDDLSQHIDMQCYFDALPPTEYPRKPHRQERIKA